MDVETFFTKKKPLSPAFCQEMIIHAIKNNNIKYAEMLKRVIYYPHILTLENALKNDEETIKKVIFFHGPDVVLYDIVFRNCDLLLDLFFKQKWPHNVPIFEYLVQTGKNKYVRQYLDTFGVGPVTLKGMITGKVSYIEIDRLIKEAPHSCTQKILSSYLPWAPVRYWQELTTNFLEDF